MTLPLPNLDDRTYADLVEEAISQISLEYPEWTDHNPTDTGIILIELLAWLTEMTLYQVNQIPDENYASFITLLKGKQEEKLELSNVSAQEKHKALQLEIKETLLDLRERYRAVTIEDYEQLVLEDWKKYTDYTGLEIKRVKGLAQRNLEEGDADTFDEGHISLVVVPENDQPNNYDNLFNFLKDRKLLTTRLHIVEPEYVSISIDAELVLKDDAKAEDLIEKAKTEMKLFFDPLNSGKYWEGKGWPFGRSIYVSEIYKLLDDLAGVDYVKTIVINGDKDLSEVYLADNQLVRLLVSKFTVEDNPFIDL
ncbi:MAG: baseplate protein J [Cyanobacteria bacterium P01_H01_bin.35]